MTLLGRMGRPARAERAEKLVPVRPTDAELEAQSWPAPIASASVGLRQLARRWPSGPWLRDHPPLRPQARHQRRRHQRRSSHVSPGRRSTGTSTLARIVLLALRALLAIAALGAIDVILATVAALVLRGSLTSQATLAMVGTLNQARSGLGGEERTLTRKLALCNQKGGVGKTATTLGLASALSHQGRDVLVVDVDPQGNSTTGLGVELTETMMTTFDLMNRTVAGSAADAVIATPWEKVDLIPSNEALANIESDGANDLIFRLDIAFEGLDLSPYDAVLFDCPPSLGKLLFAVLCAADEVIAVTEPTIDSVRGIENLQETIRNVQRRPNPNLVLEKLVLSRKRKTGEHQFRERELRDTYGDLVAKTSIPELTARQDAHSSHTPIHSFTGGKALALQVAYTDLLAELALGTEGTAA